jgi:hypothetical protein
LFAAGVSVALLLGAASPAMAMAKPAKGPKPPVSRVSGFGETQGRGVFAVDVRQAKLAKGRFAYSSADGGLRVRCDGFDTYSRRMYIAPGPPAVRLTANCVAKAPHHARTPISLEAEFVDNAGWGKADEANLTFTRQDGSTVSDSGALRKGNVSIH